MKKKTVDNKIVSDQHSSNNPKDRIEKGKNENKTKKLNKRKKQNSVVI